MSIDINDTQQGVYSADGHWQWDGRQWTPAGVAGQDLLAERGAEPARTRGAGVASLALPFGIAALAVAAFVLGSGFFLPINQVDDFLYTALLVVGFVSGQLAVVFALAPASRPRRQAQIAGFVCGLVGIGLLLLFVCNMTIRF